MAIKYPISKTRPETLYNSAIKYYEFFEFGVEKKAATAADFFEVNFFCEISAGPSGMREISRSTH